MTTSHVAIRSGTPADAKAVRSIYGKYILQSPATFEIEVPHVEAISQRIAKILEFYPYLVAEQHGDVVGYAYGSTYHARAAYRWSAEVSVYVADGYHRQGIARQLYETLFPLLRRQNLRTLIAGVTLPNEASIALHEQFGFVCVGTYPNVGYKLGAWRDVGYWSLELQPPVPDPDEPVAFEPAWLSSDQSM